MAYKISGVVMNVGQPLSMVSRNGNSFTKRDLVITVLKFDPYTGEPTADDGNTPRFTFMSEKCQQLDNLRQGDRVTVHFDIYGRRYEKDGRTEYMTDMRPFRVDPIKRFNTPSEPQPTTPSPFQTTAPSEPLQAPMSDPDDLPF